MIKVKIISIFELLIGASAVFGGYRLIAMDGLGMPKDWLAHSPFTSYVWPGLILATIVGGSYVLAAFFMWRHHKFYLETSSIAGFGLLIWVFTELYMLNHPHWLQGLYFGFGIMTIVLALVLSKTRGVRNEIKK